MSKVNNDEVFCYNKNNDGPFFTMIKITDQNKKFWKNYNDIDKNLYVHDGTTDYMSSYHQITQSGRSAFAIDYEGINEEAAQYVVVASNKPILDPNNIDITSLRMTMRVTTSLTAKFSTHMGISKTYASLLNSRLEYKNISGMMHSFAATVTKKIYPEKVYMINAPEPIMQNIIANQLQKLGINDAVFYTKVSTQKELEEDIDYYKKELAELTEGINECGRENSDSSQLANEAQSRINGLNCAYILEYVKKLDSGEIHERLVEKDDRIVIYGQDREVLANFSKSDPGEYSWFVKHPCMYSFTNAKIAVFDLAKITQLSPILDKEIFTDLELYKIHLNVKGVSTNDAQFDSENKFQLALKNRINITQNKGK